MEIEKDHNEFGPEDLQPGKIVSRFVRDVSAGKIALGVDPGNRRPEDIELISNTAAKLILYLNEYLTGAKAGKELEVLERQLSFSILVLETFGVFKERNIGLANPDEIRRLETKIDSTIKRLDQLENSLESLNKRDVQSGTATEYRGEDDLL